MAETPSNMFPLNETAPDFTLPDTVSGNDISLQNIKSDVATVIMFICNHCPYVHHIQAAFVAMANEYQAKGMQFIAISANDAENYPQDGPKEMTWHAKEHGYSFPYLYDETQEVAKSYIAACTPDFYVFDKELKCVYRGRFDAATPKNNVEVTGNELKAALDAVLTGEDVNPDQRPSLGCNIKWKD